MSAILAAARTTTDRWDTAVAHAARSAGPPSDSWTGRAGQITVFGQEAAIVRDRDVALALAGRIRDVARPADVLKAYLRDGLRAFDGRRGEFAFVLCDDRTGRICGGRDVLGRRSLAWIQHQRERWFASSILDLLFVAAGKARWNKTYLADWVLGLASRSPIETAFTGVHRCHPGEIVSVGDTVEHYRFDKLRQDIGVSSKEGDERLRTVLKQNLHTLGRRSLLAFSGGIDSTTVAVAWSRNRAIDTITYTLPIEAASGELTRRASFLRRHPATRQLEIHLDQRMFDPAQFDNWLQALPTFDDPPIGSPVLLRARAALYKASREQGFTTVVDGEGGDEIFELPASPVDLWFGGARIRALGLIAFDERFRRPLPRLRFALHLLPVRALERRFEMVTAVAPRPIAPSFISADHTAAAIDRFRERLRLRRFGDRLIAILMSSASEADRSVRERLAAHFDVNTLSPLWDPDVAEVAIALSPNDRLHRSREKAFLRDVLATWEPGLVARDATRDLSYVKLLRLMAAGVGARLIDRIAEVDLLASWIDRRSLREQLSRPSSLTGHDLDFYVRMYFGATWMSSVERSFGVKQ